ncbi:methyltransferase domain-containing protein [Chloroflexi bacterium TSY]|nr:methyltransferase domain-containing protein [Chloroflexi bacterium TSY]
MTRPMNTYEVSVQEGYGYWADQYDQEDNALIILEEALTLPMLSAIPINQVLDLGTGTGRYALHLAAQGAEVTALDQSEAMLAKARQAASHAGLSIRFIQQGLEERLPSLAERFDLVLAALVLCHVADLDAVIREIYRVVSPGGHLIITDFHPAVIAAGWRTQFTSQAGTYLLPTAGHTREQYLTSVADTGFQLQAVEEGLVRDVPPGYIPEDVLVQDGDKPFCLVIQASKPGIS